MKTKGLLCAVAMLFGVLTASSQEQVISLADLDGYFQQAERASFNSPWSVRTVVDIGDTPSGPWEHNSGWSYSVVPPDRARLAYAGERRGEFIHIGPLSYTKTEDGTWAMSHDTVRGPMVSPISVRRFGDGEISYTQSRSGETIVVTVISKAAADADPLDTRTRTYVFYFAADRDIDGRQGKITGEESIVFNGTNWVRTTNIYTFNPNIRIEAPDEKVAREPVPITVPVSREGAKNSTTDQPLRILSKPRPGYTDEARSNGLQGSVILMVTFEADGTIGPIGVLKGLEHGMTEVTLEAVRKITFTPARQHGKPVSITRQLEYRFKIF